MENIQMMKIANSAVNVMTHPKHYLDYHFLQFIWLLISEMLEKRNLLNVMHSIYQDYTKLIIETSLPPGTRTQNNGKKEQIEKRSWKEEKRAPEERMVQTLPCHIPIGASKLRSNMIIDFASKRFRTLLPTSTGKWGVSNTW